LGRVVTFLNSGQIFNQASFAFAVRKCQAYRESERIKGNDGPSSISRRPKYTLEIQTMAALVLDLNEHPDVQTDLGELHEDTLNLSNIGKANYETFFLKKIMAVRTGTIKLRPIFITKSAFEEYERIENKTKDEIRIKIMKMKKCSLRSNAVNLVPRKMS
jgi:hypothetical protein